MFIRWNDTAKYYEYDTSASSTGAGPWVKLPNIAYKDVNNNFLTHQTISVPDVAASFTVNASAGGAFIAEVDLTLPSLNLRLINYQSRFQIFTGSAPIFQNDLFGNIYLPGFVYEKNRTIPLGNWQSYTPAYVAGSGITISGGSASAQYTLIGKTMILQLQISGFTTTAGAGEFWLSLPPSISVASALGQTANVVNWTTDGSNWKQTMVYCTATDTTMRFYNVAWAGGSGNHIWGTIIVPVA